MTIYLPRTVVSLARNTREARRRGVARLVKAFRAQPALACIPLRGKATGCTSLTVYLPRTVVSLARNTRQARCRAAVRLIQPSRTCAALHCIFFSSEAPGRAHVASLLTRMVVGLAGTAVDALSGALEVDVLPRSARFAGKFVGAGLKPTPRTAMACSAANVLPGPAVQALATSCGGDGTGSARKASLQTRLVGKGVGRARLARGLAGDVAGAPLVAGRWLRRAIPPFCVADSAPTTAPHLRWCRSHATP